MLAAQPVPKSLLRGARLRLPKRLTLRNKLKIGTEIFRQPQTEEGLVLITESWAVVFHHNYLIIKQLAGEENSNPRDEQG